MGGYHWHHGQPLCRSGESSVIKIVVSHVKYERAFHFSPRISNPNAAFFLRDPSFLKDLPPDYLKIFDETSMLAREHLQVKTKLK